MAESPLWTSLYHEPDETFLQTVTAHLKNGQDPNSVSTHGVRPIWQAFRRGRMDAVSLLIENGADIAPMKWSPLHRAVALGSGAQVRALLQAGDASVRDRSGLTPFLLAVDIGDVAKAATLHPASSREDMYHTLHREPALVVAAKKRRVDMAAWLLANGFDVDDEAEFGLTALISAASADAPEIVKALLAAGARIDAQHDITASLRKSNPEQYADDENEHVQTAASETSSAAVARLLMKAGAELFDFDPRVMRDFTSCRLIPAQKITPEIFHAQKHRRFGSQNPEPVAYEYWLEAIRGKAGGYYGRRAFDIPARDLPAIWSYDRFGMSTTELPDGRWVQIAGEHEDWYNPDFCIYSDVFIFDGSGNVQIYIYPRDLFPPTDFHTATLVGNEIVVIGSLGYAEERKLGSTPVRRLRLDDFSISRMETSGAAPGWISEHRARLAGGKIIVSGGQIWNGVDLISNDASFELCLVSWVWTQLVENR